MQFRTCRIECERSTVKLDRFLEPPLAMQRKSEVIQSRERLRIQRDGPSKAIKRAFHLSEVIEGDTQTVVGVDAVGIKRNGLPEAHRRFLFVSRFAQRLTEGDMSAVVVRC